MKTQGHIFSGGPIAGLASHHSLPCRAVISSTLGLLVTSVGLFVMSPTGAPSANIDAPTLHMVAIPPTHTTQATHPTHSVKSTSTTSNAKVVRGAHASHSVATAQRAVTTSFGAATPAAQSPTPLSVPVRDATPVAKAVPAVVSSTVTLKLAANIAPSPDFLVSGTGSLVNGAVTYQNPCVTSSSTWPVITNDPACTAYVLQSINNARAVEGVGPMVLPSNWYTISTAQQLFVVANLERTARGLAPYVGLNATLSSAAQHAALANSDPSSAAGFPATTNAQGQLAMGGAWSSGFSVLAADYVWMYADGWSGAKATTANIACQSAGAPGCWGHRAELLGSDPGYNAGVGLNCANCEMGTGFAVVNGAASYVDLIEAPLGSSPPMTFTWAQNVLPYLN